MSNKMLEQLLTVLIEREVNQFTTKEFRIIYFQLFGEELNPSYLEVASNSCLRLLDALGCVRLVGKTTAKQKIYSFNLSASKKVFPDLVPNLKFDKKKVAK